MQFHPRTLGAHFGVKKVCIGQWEVWFWNCDLWWVAVQDRAFIGAARRR